MTRPGLRLEDYRISAALHEPLVVEVWTGDGWREVTDPERRAAVLTAAYKIKPGDDEGAGDA